MSNFIYHSQLNNVKDVEYVKFTKYSIAIYFYENYDLWRLIMFYHDYCYILIYARVSSSQVACVKCAGVFIIETTSYFLSKDDNNISGR